MGVSSPKFKMHYNQSNNIMIDDTTEYTNNTNTYVLIDTFKIDIAVVGSSKFRCLLDLKGDYSAHGAYIHIYHNGVSVGSVHSTTTSYATYSVNLNNTVDYKQGDEITIKLGVYNWLDNSNVGYAKNIKLAGTQSPFSEV